MAKIQPHTTPLLKIGTIPLSHEYSLCLSNLGKKPLFTFFCSLLVQIQLVSVKAYSDYQMLLWCSSYSMLNTPKPACEMCSSLLYCKAPQCVTNAVKIVCEKWNPWRQDIFVLWKLTLISHPSSQSCPRLTASKTKYNCTVNVLGNWCTILSLYELFISGCCFSKL